MSDFISKLGKKINAPVPQSQPLHRAGRKSADVKMASGGYAFAQDEWARLKALAILGNSNGSYYAGAEQIQDVDGKFLINMVNKYPQGVLDLAHIVSVENLTLKNTVPLMMLATVIRLAPPDVKDVAWKLMPQMARTGSDFLTFVTYLMELGVKFGRKTRRGVANWYLSKDPKDVLYQMLKYKERSGMSHERVFRLAHVTAQANKSQEHHNFFYAKVTDWLKTGNIPVPLEDEERWSQVRAASLAHGAKNSKQVAKLVKNFRLGHEMVPTQYAGDKLVWTALLSQMPMTAMIRNLGRMTSYGVFESDANVDHVQKRLLDKEALVKARVHPLSLVMALKTYASGKGNRGSLTWRAHNQLIDYIDEAFYLTMDLQAPSKKTIAFFGDTSGSMDHVLSSGLHYQEASAALAMTAVHKYNRAHIFGVDDDVLPLSISKRQRLDDAVKQFYRSSGGTQLDTAFSFLINHNIKVDGIIIATDNESWAGHNHCQVVWEQYRSHINPAAKCLFIQYQAQGYVLSDPDDSSVRTTAGFGPEIFTIIDMMMDGQL